ncbi:hypothetical protein JCM16161A_13680 [Vulcanisaeta sp. JCM 16161]
MPRLSMITKAALVLALMGSASPLGLLAVFPSVGALCRVSLGLCTLTSTTY